VLALLAVIWSAAWLVMGVAGLVPGTTTASALVVLSMAVFALGETLLSPIAPAMANDLAPEHLRGRYNAASSLAFQVAAISAPVSAGFLIGHEMPVTYVGTLLAGCVALGVLALRMERVLPPAANGVRDGSKLAVAPTLETVPEQV
jgi:MFS family permease